VGLLLIRGGVVTMVRGAAAAAAPPLPAPSSVEPPVEPVVAVVVADQVAMQARGHVRGAASLDIGEWEIGSLDASIGCLTGYLARVIDDPQAALALLDLKAASR
jgi:hypothetical protein